MRSAPTHSSLVATCACAALAPSYSFEAPSPARSAARRSTKHAGSTGLERKPCAGQVQLYTTAHGHATYSATCGGEVRCIPRHTQSSSTVVDTYLIAQIVAFDGCWMAHMVVERSGAGPGGAPPPRAGPRKCGRNNKHQTQTRRDGRTNLVPGSTSSRVGGRAEGVLSVTGKVARSKLRTTSPGGNFFTLGDEVKI